MHDRQIRKMAWDEHAVLVMSLLIVFGISSNIAWLNPRPEWGPNFKLSRSVPVLWQYHGDAEAEFLSAEFFPNYFRTDGRRINRPVYSMLAHVLGSPMVLALRSFGTSAEASRKWGTAFGFILIKLAVYTLSAYSFYYVAHTFVSSEAALFGTLLILFHDDSILNATRFHTTELQLFTPVLLAAIGIFAWKRGLTWRFAFLTGLVVGVLMLTRQNYASFLAIIGTATLAKQWRFIAIAVSAHVIPLALWLCYLMFEGIPYHNYETQKFGQGIWLFTELPAYSWTAMGEVLCHLFQLFCAGFFRTFSVCGVVAVFFLPSFLRDKSIRRVSFVLPYVTLLLGATLLQFIAARRGESYLTGDVAVVVFLVAAFGMERLFVRILQRPISKTCLLGMGVLWLLANTFRLAELPWVHPLEQPVLRWPSGVL